MSRHIRAIAASPGLACGIAHVVEHRAIATQHDLIEALETDAEVDRFLRARALAREQLEAVQKEAEASLGAEHAEVFEGHLEFLLDEDILQTVRERISSDRWRACRAVLEAYEENARGLEELVDNPYMQERAADVREVCNRLLHCLAGRPYPTLDALQAPRVVVADDLGPAETAQMDPCKVLALVMQRGGKTSHVAIMARSLGIPAVVGASDILQHIEPGQQLAVDGHAGELIIRPSDGEAAEFARRIQEERSAEAQLMEFATLAPLTQDGHTVELCANVGSAAEASRALDKGAMGVGLFRTEFLFMEKRQAPDVQEQTAAYRAVGEGMGGRPVIVRTLDVGGDKPLSFVDFPVEDNPFLGWRGIRMCLDRRALFEQQLEAIVRASAHTKLRIMYPMVTGLEEIRRANGLLANVQSKLADGGIAYDRELEVGIMIETPGAALIAPWLAEEVDFFSIGTNDLTQYTLAVDRGNERVAALYEPLHPAMLKLYEQVARAAHDAGKWLGMCGELASQTWALPLLVGLGFDELSMAAPAIPAAKRCIRSMRQDDARAMARRALACRTTAEVAKVLKNFAVEAELAVDLQGAEGAGRGGQGR